MGFMISGINNAAHIGGMLMGAAMTLIWYIGQRSKHSNVHDATQSGLNHQLLQLAKHHKREMNQD
ncbi:Uncharacterised protein [Mycobacteroides abscessus subsp. abscessus]|nr:Uncharacterised protein [Mycobacteroides abscessus subsp. abscessus]